MDNRLSLAFERCGFKSGTISINNFLLSFLFDFFCLLISSLDFVHNWIFYYVYASNIHEAQYVSNKPT